MIYILTHEWQFDSGENGMEVEAFETLEAAQIRQQELIQEARNDAPDYVEERSEKNYSRYEDGEYCYNHINIDIWAREIRG